jgi:uncharacterized protein
MMFLLDSNVWLALSMEVHTFHQPTRDWLHGTDPDDIFVFCRATQQALLRLLTTTAVWKPYALPPLTNVKAWAIYTTYLQDPMVKFMVDPPDLEQEWHQFAIRSTASPKLWMDAYLAAFAKDAGLTLVTTDKAFLQFKGCKVQLLA